MFFKMSFIGIVFLVIGCVSCVKHNAYFMNTTLETQVKNFLNDARKYTKITQKKATVLLFFKRWNSNYQVSFHYRKPDNFNNLHAVVDNDTLVIFIYSNTDISKFVFSEPNKIDTTHYNVQILKNDDIDWYSDLLYFNGKEFGRDSLKFK